MSDVHPFNRLTPNNAAMAHTRFKNVTLEGLKDENWKVLARPSGLHGAMVQFRLKGKRWQSEGWEKYRLLIGGNDLTESQLSLVPEELGKLLA